MYIFIDESGIHKDVDHSVYVLVYIGINDCEYFDKVVLETEKNLKIKEFHWAETTWAIKEKFLDKILKLDFELKVAVINNPINPSRELERVLSHLLIEKDIKCVFIDGKKPKWYERKIKNILRSKNFSVRKLKTVKSNQFPGIRVADMAAGLIRTFYDSRKIEKVEKFYKRLEKKIIITVK
ncbi:MAG TPA: DUF3800 domain-containing protein [Candidatus Woesebacteria bacterium]|nr:DUF3800 domain-containing protein [Candidatus Woesebacteria bacterium]